MQKRLNVNTTEPKALKAMLGLETYLSEISISNTLKELIKIRASQINGCAYCINMHTKEAMEKGEESQRIFLLNAWKETNNIFTDEERVLLAITEEVTLIHQNGLSDITYEKAIQFFSENQIAEIIMAIITINSWNRIAISGYFQPE